MLRLDSTIQSQQATLKNDLVLISKLKDELQNSVDKLKAANEQIEQLQRELEDNTKATEKI